MRNFQPLWLGTITQDALFNNFCLSFWKLDYSWLQKLLHAPFLSLSGVFAMKVWQED